MSTLLKKLLQVAVPVSAAAVMTMAATGANAGITATKHFLGSASTNTNRVTSGTDEICVFCHTPHGANTGVAAPLWNKAVPATTGYTTYSSTTMDAGGTGAAGALAIGSVSLACLSCHDGTQAMDNIINSPGSGGYDATGGGTGGLAYTWNAGARINADGTGRLANGGTFIAALGQDLSNDHPIGIAYCGWSTATAAAIPAGNITSANCADPDFKQATKVTGKAQWWVDSESTPDGVKEKTDMILYTRTFTSPAGDGPSVECASCHDPHTDSTVTFLRTANTASAVCLACHNK